MLWIGFVEGEIDGLSLLLQEMRCFANQQGYSRIGGFFPQDQVILNALQQSGYEPLPNEAFWVYEKRLDRHS